MQLKTRIKCILLISLGLFTFCGVVWALPEKSDSRANALHHDRSIIILAVDKLDSIEFFNSKLPGVQRLLSEAACGLMNIRTGSGYSTNNGYLTLGMGVKNISIPDQGGAFHSEQRLIGGKAWEYLNWSFGVDESERNGLIVPEISAIIEQAKSQGAEAGVLGTALDRNGWKTFLLGNSDTVYFKNRPAGYLVMDNYGRINDGNVTEAINGTDPEFPYFSCLSPAKAFPELRSRVMTPNGSRKNFVVVEFGDFARLDYYRDEITPSRFRTVKQLTWERFDYLLSQILNEWNTGEVSLIVISPSISKESSLAKSLLAPIVIRDAYFFPGLLTSGTTNWAGLVSNVDFLPTVFKIANLPLPRRIAGGVIQSVPFKGRFFKLSEINWKILSITQNQRSMLDWYLGLISFGWVLGLICIYLKKKLFGDWILTLIAAIPFSLLILPVFPPQFWRVGYFLLLNLVLSGLLVQVRNVLLRFLLLSGFLWLVLIIDQFCGWSLIRFSALGYSPTAGSRYYGMGNEYMGIFLGVTLIFIYLINRLTSWDWPAPVILGLSLLVLGWPKLGTNFGGLLGAIPGFTYYFIKKNHWKLNNRKFWVLIVSISLLIVFVGVWDSLRSFDKQTHIGRFFHMVFNKEFTGVWQIITRKVVMNAKLLAVSPWARIIILSLFISVIKKFFVQKQPLRSDEKLLWQSVLLSGIVALLVNDSGVVALATCLAYSFSFWMISRTLSVAIDS